LDVDFATEKMEVFREAWTTFAIRSSMRNSTRELEGLRSEYEPRVAGAGSPDEMRRSLD